MAAGQPMAAGQQGEMAGFLRDAPVQNISQVLGAMMYTKETDPSVAVKQVYGNAKSAAEGRAIADRIRGEMTRGGAYNVSSTTVPTRIDGPPVSGTRPVSTTMPVGQLVRVQAPDGEIRELPASQAQRAIQLGARRVA